MELKNAIAVCLITLFSATLVLLTARALDLQAASRLEPQLAKIFEELEAIRKSGGIVPGSGVAAENDPVEDAVMVYYLHGNVRCPTCRAIESQAHETVQSAFASQVEAGEVVWKILNYEEPDGMDLGRKFEVQMPVVVLARISGGQIEDWKRLDEVWALVGDQPAYAKYVRDEVTQMLEAAAPQPTPASPESVPEIPLPAVDVSDLPVPGVGTEPDGPPMDPEASPSARNDDAPSNVLRISGFHDTPVSNDSAVVAPTR